MENINRNLEKNTWLLNGSEIAVVVWVFLSINICITIFALYPNATAYKTKWLIIGLVFINLMLMIRLYGTLHEKKKTAQKHRLNIEKKFMSLIIAFLKKSFFLLLISIISWGILFLVRFDMIYAIGMSMVIAIAIDGLFLKGRQDVEGE